MHLLPAFFLWVCVMRKQTWFLLGVLLSSLLFAPFAHANYWAGHYGDSGCTSAYTIQTITPLISASPNCTVYSPIVDENTDPDTLDVGVCRTHVYKIGQGESVGCASHASRYGYNDLMAGDPPEPCEGQYRWFEFQGSYNCWDEGCNPGSGDVVLDSGGNPVSGPREECEGSIFQECLNGQLDPFMSDPSISGEVAIDCGGGCGDCPEDLFCPENTSIFWTPVVTGLDDGDIEAMECSHVVDPDQYGNCPPGYSTVIDILSDGSSGPNNGRCGTHVAFASIYEADGNDIFNPTVPDSSGSFSVVEQVYPDVSETDPVTGNTTTTQTSTTTKTDSNGNTVTEEKTRIIVTDPDGNVLSDTTQTNYDGPAYSDGDARLLAENARIAEGVEGIQDTLDDALTTDTPLDGYGDFDGLIPEDLMPEENDINNLIDGWISNSPISAYIASLEIQEVNPTACISGSVFGEPISICFDEPHFQDFYVLFRGLLISLAYISGAIYLMRKAG